MPRSSRVKVRRGRRRAVLSPEDRNRFAFLFKRLQGTPPDDCPDVDTILKRCKAAGVSLEELSNHLLIQLATDSNPATMPTLRQMQGEIDLGVKSFKQAQKHLRRVPTLLRVPGVCSPAVFELLDACASVLQEAKTMAHRLVEGRRALEARYGAKVKGRKRQPGVDELTALGLSRDHDARPLRRAVRIAAKVSPLRYGEGASMNHVGYDRCKSCGNPAPLLFKASKE